LKVKTGERYRPHGPLVVYMTSRFLGKTVCSDVFPDGNEKIRSLQQEYEKVCSSLHNTKCRLLDQMDANHVQKNAFILNSILPALYKMFLIIDKVTSSEYAF